MAIASLKEFEKKTKDYLNELKEEVKRFERVVNNTNDKLRWEGASYVLDSISKSAESVAKAMRDFQNNLKMGKVEESVKEHKTFRKYLKESVLQTQNEGWGFFGTISNEFDHNAYANAKEAWKIAFQEVQKATGWTDVEVREWLDSRDGRHFADQCADFGAANNMKDGISQGAKFYKERKWFQKIKD